jgi:glyoxylase-like metal-dependent hydrolase (beta-lactamase superfamily II)
LPHFVFISQENGHFKGKKGEGRMPGRMNQDECRLIEIPQALPGYNSFIGSWLYRGDVNILADVGPAASASRLIESLSGQGVHHIDYILLTHIHIDHAGGLSACLEHFPMARIMCHRKGIRHLVDPSRLWEVSVSVLGEIARAYGRPMPVPEDAFIPHTDIPMADLTVIETPGHAPHHLSFSFRGHLFAGEAAGNYCAGPAWDYLRPATPPRFFLEVFLESLDRLMALKDQHIGYAHFGEARSSHEMLARFRAQVLRWRDVIQEEIARDLNDVVGRCVHRLLEEDPDLRAHQFMEPDVQQRERFFIGNSVRGYLGFLQDS